MEECDTIAPWFATSGDLTISCWDKQGRDLDFAWEQGTLKAGVRPVWKLVRSCLEDHKCCKAVEEGQTILEMIEERSEKAESEKGAKSIKNKEKEEEKCLYPSLKGLLKTSGSPQSSDSEDSESPCSDKQTNDKEMATLIRKLSRTKARKRKK